MSATMDLADPMASEDFATTLLAGAAAETPTPATEPAPEPATTTDEAETPADDSPAEPAKETPPPAEPEQPKPEEKPQWQLDLEAAREAKQRAEREAATLRGQVENAARQAYERGQQETARQLRQNQRQELLASLQEMVNAGETTLEAANARVARFDNDEAARARQELEHATATERANMQIGGVALEMDHATVRLHQAGIPSMAQQAELPEEYARQFFDQEEVTRYQRAIGQAKMAQRAPGQGFNAKADEDYLNTAWRGLHLAGQIYKTLSASHAEALAAKDKQIADLTMQLNRDGAPDAPPETPARGAGRKPRTADEQTTQILTEHADALLAALRG